MGRPADELFERTCETCRRGARRARVPERHDVSPARGIAEEVIERRVRFDAVGTDDANGGHPRGDAPGNTRGVARTAGDDDQVRWPRPRRGTEDRSLGSLRHAAREGDRLLDDRLDAPGAQRTTQRIAQADAVFVVVIEHGRGAGPQRADGERGDELGFGGVVGGHHENPGTHGAEAATGAGGHEQRDVRFLIDGRRGQAPSAVAVSDDPDEAGRRGEPRGDCDLPRCAARADQPGGGDDARLPLRGSPDEFVMHDVQYAGVLLTERKSDHCCIALPTACSSRQHCNDCEQAPE